MKHRTTGHDAKGTSYAIPSTALFILIPILFAITWGVLGAYIFANEAMSAVFGPLEIGRPLYFLATWAPAIAAVIVVMLFAGATGLKAFLSRLFLWRAPLVWWAFILIGVPVVFMLGSLLKGGGLLADVSEVGLGTAFGYLGMMLFLGPIEEFGWRGVAQPILQRHMAPVWAGALIGLIWGIWHLPAFYLSSTVYADWSFLPFFIGNVTLAILVTPIFNAARGSILVPMLFHWQLINPFWPDAQPYDTWILVGVTAIILIWKRDRMFTRKGAVTTVVPPIPHKAPMPRVGDTALI